MQALIEKLVKMTIRTETIEIVENTGGKNGMVKREINRFNITGFPASPIDLLLWLLKDQLAGQGKLDAFYNWFAPAMRVSARNCNKKILNIGKATEKANTDWKEAVSFRDVFIKRQAPASFKKSLLEKITALHTELATQDQMATMLRNFATGKKLEEGLQQVTDAKAAITQKITEAQADVAKLDNSSK